MNKLEKLWAGDFGDKYIERNRLNPEKRKWFWKIVLSWIKEHKLNILEVGCNIGINLMAIEEVLDSYYKFDNTKCFLHGCDVNWKALEEAGVNTEARLKHASILNLPYDDDQFDLVFTCGVLIHIKNIKKAIKELKRVANHYIVIIEYMSEKEENIKYRGKYGRLWKRNYGKLFKDRNWENIGAGILKNKDGFDNTTYWFFRRKKWL